jgi:hypothetical protein
VFLGGGFDGDLVIGLKSLIQLWTVFRWSLSPPKWTNLFPIYSVCYLLWISCFLSSDPVALSWISQERKNIPAVLVKKETKKEMKKEVCSFCWYDSLIPV